MGTVRRDCRWAIRYGGAWYCRRLAFVNPSAPMKKLDLGCDCDPNVDYQPLQGKADLYRDPDETGDAPRTVEWDDEEGNA